MKKLETPKRAMVVTPHPDDAEIGCGGTVAQWTHEGAEVIYVLCTNGDKGSQDPDMTPERLAAIREKEQSDAAAVLRVKEVVFLRHQDGELEDTREFRGELVRAIRQFQPDVVFCPDPFRRSFYLHRDHRICGQVTIDAVFPYSRDRLHFFELTNQGFQPHKVGTILMWGTEEPDTFVDITDTLELKCQSLLCHASQVSNPGQDAVKFVREFAETQGAKGGMKYAEAFRIISLRR